MPTLEDLKKMLEEKKKYFEQIKAEVRAVAGQVALLGDLIEKAEKAQS